MSDYYDRHGNPITSDRARTLKTAPSYRGVALTTLPNGTYVATDWMGLDWRHHAHDPGLPLIFETMVYGGPLSGQAERYSTETQALAGHDQWAARVRNASKGQGVLVTTVIGSKPQNRGDIDKAVDLLQHHQFSADQGELRDAVETVLEGLDRYWRAYMEEIGEPVEPVPGPTDEQGRPLCAICDTGIDPADLLTTCGEPEHRACHESE
jgi:hypothetical protein